MISLPVHREHPRSFADNLYVYPVVSRRSRGVSIGVNLNPDKVCNFDCVYCQVDRTTPGPTDHVDRERLRNELDDLLALVASGALFTHERFRDTPPHLRRLNDIAFSGDGEPTTCPQFAEVVATAAEARRDHGLAGVKLVLITNATMFHRSTVQAGLRELTRANGEVWAKLEAGTEAYYHRVDRTTIPFQRILDNITAEARRAPLVIQSRFLKRDGEPPPVAELHAYCDRLRGITNAGGQIKLVQVYTIARRPAESFAGALADAEVDAITTIVRDRTGLPAEPYYGGVE